MMTLDCPQRANVHDAGPTPNSKPSFISDLITERTSLMHSPEQNLAAKNIITERFDPKAKPFRPNARTNGETGAPEGFPEINVTAWHGQPVPEREWTVHNRIIRRNVG